MIQIRLTRQLHDVVRTDLRRPHPFAAERVGFLFGQLDKSAGGPLVLLTAYEPVADERYVRDRHVGARIDGQAIRCVMQRVISRRECAFHTHWHEWPGTPRFSPTDHDELPRVVQGFRNAGPALAHGMFLFSNDECAAWVWTAGTTAPAVAGKISVVGFPFQSFEGGET